MSNKSPTTARWGFLLLAACVIITFSCCPAGTGEDGDGGDGEDDRQAVAPVDDESIEEAVEETPMDETAREGEAEAADDTGEKEEPEPDRFQPTEEQPLAPPAQPAVGAERLPEGEIGLAVSLGGTGGPVALISGITLLAPERLLMQCTVANNTEETVAFTFMTSQKLDAIFTDVDGNPVYQWSTGRRFAQVVNALELESGESWSHEITIPVGTGENELLPGAYNVLVMLTGDPTMVVTASEVVIAR